MEVAFIRHFTKAKPTGAHDSGFQQPLAPQAQEEAPLTAGKLDELIQSLGIQTPEEIVVLCSPAKRTQDSYFLCLNHSSCQNLLPQTPQTTEWLREVDSGQTYDLSKEELEALYPNHQAEWRRLMKEDPCQIKAPYGETPHSRYEAVQQANFPAQLKNWKKQGVKLVICVSHKTTINAIRAVLRGEDENQMIRGERLSTGGILHATANEQGEIGELNLHHGKYTCISAEKLIKGVDQKPAPISSISLEKIAHHEALKRLYPQGLLAQEESYTAPEGRKKQFELLLREEMRAMGGHGEDKNPLPDRK